MRQTRLGEKNFFFFLIISLLLLPQSTLFAQPESERGLPFIVNYSPKTFNGLPQVWSVQEDDRGIMYFGSGNCLLEYDGNKWAKIPFNNNASGSARAMAKDKDGTI